MAQFRVKNRDFQRAPADWLHRARRGDIVVIVSPEGPLLTLSAGAPARVASWDWTRHFEWLERQPVCDSNPVDDLRRAERR